jgi:hypothetical protein
MKDFFRFTPQVGLFAFLLFLLSNASAQTLPTISYQGVLQNNGATVNGTDTLKILIYQYETGGTPLYTETQATDIVNGIFNISIGSVTPLQPTLDFTKQYYLTVSVNGGPELTPRSLVSFAPYAFHALNADTAIYASRASVANGVSGGVVNSVNGDTYAVTLSGNNGITISNNPPNITIGSTGVQSLNGVGGILTLAGAGGTTVTNAGTKITITSPVAESLNGASGAVSLVGEGATTIADSGATLIIRTTALTGIQNSDNTIAITNPNGPTATIGLAGQSASAGQILQWNGSAWRPATVSGVGADSIKNLGDARVNSTSLFLGAGAGTQGEGADNVAVGIAAMDSNTSGDGNTTVGWESLFSNKTGNFNTAEGVFALQNNTTGGDNVAIGVDALKGNTSGSDNTSMGYSAMLGAVGANTGSSNCAFGYFALAGINAGSDNVSCNTAIGASALDDCWNGSYNVAVGDQALQSAGSTSFLVAVGDSALQQNARTTPTGDSATENTAIGSASLARNVMGAYNTATGFQTLHQNASGYHNTANGASALWNNTGSYNTATGSQSLIANTSGNNNSAFGYLALGQNTTGSNNAAFGDNSGPAASNLSNTTSLGSGAQASASNSVVLGNQNVTTLYCQGAYAATTANSANMFVNSTGQIMRSTSSARYKTNIHDLDINTDKLYDLRPVSYTSKIDGKEYFGLVAEDVAKVLPDLAEYARAKDVITGSTSDEMIPDAVKYPMLSVLLLDELKKEHEKVETQEKQLEFQAKINADMERRLEALEASQKSTR